MTDDKKLIERMLRRADEMEALTGSDDKKSLSWRVEAWAALCRAATDYKAAAARLEALTATQGEVVAWQWRHRTRRNEARGWSEWSDWKDGHRPALRTIAYESELRPLYTHPTPCEAAAYETCSSCGGSGLQLSQSGEPTECHECRGDTVVHTHPTPDRGELVEALRAWKKYDQLLRTIEGPGPLYGGVLEEVDAAYDACVTATEAALTKHGGDRG